jgi:endonuclease/exonuclease/phosphatase family metal-dependent hydrolase
MPVVFTADLNAKPDSEPYRIMTETLEDARVNAADKQEYGTFHGTHPETMADRYIDCILMKPGVESAVYRTVTVGVNGRFVSDHFPIYADVRFGGAADCAAGE